MKVFYVQFKEEKQNYIFLISSKFMYLLNVFIYFYFFCFKDYDLDV